MKSDQENTFESEVSTGYEREQIKKAQQKFDSHVADWQIDVFYFYHRYTESW